MRSPRLLILGTVLLGLILSLPSSSYGGEFQAGNYPDISTQTSTDNSLTMLDSNECQEKSWNLPYYLSRLQVYCCDATYKIPCLENKQTVLNKLLATLAPMEQRITWFCSKTYIPQVPACTVSALADESQEATLYRGIGNCVTQITEINERIETKLRECNPDALPVIY